MIRTLVLLMVPLLFAASGCFAPADDADVVPAAQPEPHPPSPSPAPSPPVNATPARGEPAAAPNTTDAEPPAPRLVPFAFEGSLPTFAKACVLTRVQDACQDVPPGAALDNSFLVNATGNATAFHLTLTWEATSAATEWLRVLFLSVANETSTEHAHVVGASPLVLEIEGPLWLAEHMAHRIEVHPMSSGIGSSGGGIFVHAATEQPFSLEGSLLLEPVLAATNP